MRHAAKSILAPAARMLDRLDIGIVRLLQPMRSEVPQARSRIIVWTMDRIGDVQRATPLIRGLKTRYPDAQLTCIVASRAAAILESNPFVDNLHRVQDPYRLLHHRRYLRELGSRGFDFGVIAEVDPAWAKLGQIMLRRLRVPHWYGFALGNATHPCETLIPLLSERSWTEMFTRLAAEAGAEGTEGTTEVFLSESDRQAASEILRSSGIGDDPFAVIHPGTGSLIVSRRWPSDRFGAVAKHVADRWNIKPVITGTASERDLTAACIGAAGPHAIDLTGKIGLRTLVALIERAAVVVTNDTGPLHIAVALRRPVVTVLGPTSPQIVGLPPYAGSAIRANLACQPCAGLTGWKACSNVQRFACLDAVSTAAVIEAVDRELGRRPPGTEIGFAHARAPVC